MVVEGVVTVVAVWWRAVTCSEREREGNREGEGERERERESSISRFCVGRERDKYLKVCVPT